jgi:hypothetical protein
MKSTSVKIAPIPNEIRTELETAAKELLFAIQRETNKDNPDFTLISRMVKAAKLLPVYLPELQKYF